MSDYSPTPSSSSSSSSYQTPATSPSEALGERAFQLLGLSIDLARAERTAKQLEASLYNTTRVLDNDITQLRDEMNAILRLREEDLKRAQRRHNHTFLFCVLVVWAAIVLSPVFQHGGARKFF
ncbi:hypothetical protein FPCIR_8071 [Fusarium pseudocircinatum]|uniref:Uncharacterized protein n=1 Tax=Fusarium pseudocircinatum TaxID=56676 RepID=A0A8H5L8J2_9HYPO|nr:hypothetical protein FPCIR_8071 [Fusarium pseudocircinatum]